MNILILGSGGREHALAWRLAQDESCTKIYVWPGNPGMDFLPFEFKHKLFFVSEAFSEELFSSQLSSQNIDLVIPGAEKFLYDGVANWCEKLKVPCFGPKTDAAALERSKLFSKQVMTEAKIPTARYADLSDSFDKDFDQALSTLKEFSRPVIKISGPSLGKGVFVCADYNEAAETLKQIKEQPMGGMEEGLFVEEAVSGKEISLFYACHGEKYHFLGAAQDHKRLLDHDKGPNTGGMGTISPVPWADNTFIEKVTETFLKPTLKRMQERGTPFEGVLFLGLMVDGNEMNLLEYNVRFGDPETQVLMPMIQGDLTKALAEISAGKSSDEQLKFKSGVAVHVVKAARGYPGLFGETVEKGQKINSHVVTHPDVQFFFAGVAKAGSDLITSGGRVLGITARAADKESARALAYEKINELNFTGEQYRRDIGSKA